jgi:cell division topological specificity factor
MLDGFLKKLLGKPSDSKNVAKQRLKFALIYDKLEVSDNILENLHRDMVEVISRYFEIDRDAFKLDIHRSDELSALVVNTPILGAKRRNASKERETPNEPKQKEKAKAESG